MGENKRSGKTWSPFAPKSLFPRKVSPLQYVQLAYIATKKAKLPKSTQAINCYKDKMGRNQKRNKKVKL